VGEEERAGRRVIARRIRAARVARGWTQRDLASRFGCSQQNLSDIERGNVSLDLENLQRLAALLGLSLFHFLPTGDLGEEEEAVLQALRALPPGPVRDAVLAGVRLLVQGAIVEEGRQDNV